MLSGNKKIAIMMFQYSVVVKGLENKLKESGFQVETISGGLELARSYKPDISLYIVYLPRDITEDDWKIKTLAKVTEMIASIRSNMILLGEKTFHAELVSKLPEIDTYEWVDKPVDMNRFSALIAKMLDSSGTSKKRILIVDDDPSYAKMVREWIRDDYRVDIVTAGMQAISFLLKLPEGEQVDLILLDYEMPVVDGPQVLQMLRQEHVTAKIPVIFLTGIGTKDAVERVMGLKPEGYVLKSTTRQDLLTYLKGKL